MGKKTNLKMWVVMAVLLVGMAPAIAVGEVIYVDYDASPGGDGSSWATAYKYLQDALADANANPDINDVWVAQGIYTPDSNSANPNGSGDYTATFQLLDGVAVKGGYAGLGEPDPNAHDIDAYKTILSGDLNSDDVEVNDPCDLPTEPTRDENSYHVVTGSGCNQTAVLDGFVITGGNADGNDGYDYNKGGGFYSDSGSPLISNCTFTGNSSLDYGGGLFIGGFCDAVVADCEIIGNLADDGGGIFTDEMDCSPLITNCIIKNNVAIDNGGGIRCDDYSTTTIANCLITANMSGDEGGGVACKWECSPKIYDCTITGNVSDVGGGVYCKESSLIITNSILWNNDANKGQEIAMELIEGEPSLPSDITISYSDVQGGRTSAYVDPCCVLNWDVGNIDTDPFFVQLGYWADANDPNIILEPNDPNAVWVDGNYRLSPGSPCIDAGDNNSVPADIADLDGDSNTVEAVPWDLDGNLRFMDDPGTSDTGSGDPLVVDMGAYEFQDISVDVIYVDDDAPPSGDGAGWGTAYKYLQDALAVADAYTDIRVAQGIYLPDRDSAHPGGTGNRRETFELMNNVALYGGYAGIGEPNQDERDIELYETILSGDFDGDDGPDFANYTENSWHVITASGTERSAILDGFTITGGNANYPDENACGAGMYCDNGKPTLSNCAFLSNSAEFGGGIYNANNSHPKLANCTFENNRATVGSGGGIYSINSGQTTLAGCSFISNSANVNGHGGGMYNYSSSHSTLTDCTFRGNSVVGHGGGIYSHSSNSTMTNCRFIHNSGSPGGGSFGAGIYIYTYLHTLTNCTFIGNSCSSAGGIYTSNATLRLIQCLFSGNSATSSSGVGGAMYTSGSSTLTNCTFSGNSATSMGGAIYNFSNLSLCNCILWGNSPGPNPIYGSATVTFSCIQDDDPNDDSIPFGGTTNGNIDDNPLFADANGPDDVLGTEDDNVRPTQGARCIDAGNNECAEAVGLTSDLDGKPRFIDDCKTSDWGPGEPPIIDMGAYEFLPGDFDVDGVVDWLDLDFFTDRWLYTGCSKTNFFCDGADLNCGGTVEFKDFAKLARYWLEGVE